MTTGADQDANANRTQMLQAAERTQMGASLECPVCRARNLSVDTYCAECGFLLTSTPSDEIADTLEEAPASLTDTRSKQKFLLWPGSYTVGRENADILLNDSSVSRYHATVEVREGDAQITDVGSTNGTTVNGQKITSESPTTLTSGQEVRFGNSILVFEMAHKDDQEEAAETGPDETPEPCQDETANGEPTGEDPSADKLKDDKTEPAPEPEPRAYAFLEDLTDAATRYEIPEDGATIGRREGHDIVIANPYISSNHAQIALTNGVYTLSDTGSTNGTTLNGRKLPPHTPQALADGDEIAFGGAALIFRRGSGHTQ